MADTSDIDRCFGEGSLIHNEFIRIEAKRQYQRAIERLNRTTDREINEAMSKTRD